MDFIRIRSDSVGEVNLTLDSLGLSWPPPERLVIDSGGKIRAANDDDDPCFMMERVSMSALTDADMETAEHLARGALYTYVIPWQELA